MNPVIATWFHADTVETKSHFSQVGGDSTTSPFQAVYWRCVLTFFASSLRWNPECRHVFVTNLTELPSVEGIAVEEWMNERHIIVIRNVGLTRVTPEGYWRAWRNQFYVFDALKALEDGCAGAPAFFLFDSDCVWMAPHDRLSAIVAREGAALYTLSFDAEHEENGVMVRDLGLIGETLLHRPLVETPAYSGGEMIACDARVCKAINEQIDALYRANLESYAAGRPYLKEEAQFLSIIYAWLGIAPETANAVIRRIWTGRRYHDERPEDMQLDIWHLPDEKRLGLARLFRVMVRGRSWFWLADADTFRKQVGLLVGVPRRSQIRFQWARLVNRVARLRVPQ